MIFVAVVFIYSTQYINKNSKRFLYRTYLPTTFLNKQKSVNPYAPRDLSDFSHSKYQTQEYIVKTIKYQHKISLYLFLYKSIFGNTINLQTHSFYDCVMS